MLIGNGGTENGPSRGYVTAYDAETGKQAWRFYIVPGNPSDGFENDAMRMAAKTWTGQWWLHGGGGNAWHGFTYDAELDQLYIGTGNGSPWNRKIRSPEGGDNLFLCSIVALDPDTGEYRWHYQTTPGETWDFNSNMDIVLADLPIEGRPRKVILHAPKNGFFYVIDRANGKLISAEPFTKTTWASRIDIETGRPVEVEGARYERGVATVAPTPLGAHSWHAMSFNPKTGLAYYPAMHVTATFNDKGFDPKTWRATPWSIGLGVGGQFVSGASRPGTSLSSLQAWDPVRQRERQAVRGDSRRVGWVPGRTGRPAVGGARMGVRRAQALSRGVLARRQGGTSGATAADVRGAIESGIHGESRASSGRYGVVCAMCRLPRPWRRGRRHGARPAGGVRRDIGRPVHAHRPGRCARGSGHAGVRGHHRPGADGAAALHQAASGGRAAAKALRTAMTVILTGRPF